MKRILGLAILSYLAFWAVTEWFGVPIVTMNAADDPRYKKILTGGARCHGGRALAPLVVEASCEFHQIGLSYRMVLGNSYWNVVHLWLGPWSKEVWHSLNENW